MTQTDKQAHTPGPWHVQGLQVDPHGIIRIGGFEIVTEAYDVVGGNPGVAPIRKREDAYLIAGAPDLLETLATILGLLGTIEVLGEWEAEDSHVRQRAEERAKVNEAVDNARAAIAKARAS